MNLPNKLTMLRILMIPVFMVFIELNSLPNHILWAFVVFVLVSLTDMLDGKIARKYNLVTDFGKFMDPLADKILVTAALIYFIPLRLAPAWIVILILAREFLVTSLRLIASGKGIVIAADKWGKYKTATTMVWICYALLMTNFIDTMSIGMQSMCTGIHIALMILSLALTLLSGFNYLWKNHALIAQAK